MAKIRVKLANISRLTLIVLTTTPLIMVVPILFLLIITPPWTQYIGLQNNGVRTQAQVIAVEQVALIYGRSAINVNYRYSPLGQNQVIYTGQQSLYSNPPPVGSLVPVTYAPDNPTVSQLANGPGISGLIGETLLLCLLTVAACIPMAMLAMRIADRIWGEDRS